MGAGPRRVFRLRTLLYTALLVVAGIVLGLAAVLVHLASAYPVVFLGQSFVSPNLGTTLLYDEFPTLPGYASRKVTDVKLSDIGAVMWSHIPLSTIQHRALAAGMRRVRRMDRRARAGGPLFRALPGRQPV